MNSTNPLLLVFSDDWGRHPSSSQHLIRRLLGRYNVVWVNTIGTRALKFNWITVKRAYEKAISWLSISTEQESIIPKSAIGNNPQVLNPRMLPSFGGRIRRKVNKNLLIQQITPVLKEYPGEVIAITTVPYVSDLIGQLPVNKWIYYCVDDWSCWPEMDSTTLQTMESELIQKADQIICVSHALQSRIESQSNKTVQLLQHGFDEQFLKHPKSRLLLKQYPGRKILYWGLIDARLDESIVTACAHALPNDSFIFVGPMANPPEGLFVPPNVYSHGIVNYDQLPKLAAEADVLIMPYQDSAVTRQIQPLKMLEYLAVDKPVVARRLPATEEWADCLDLADSPAEFVKWVKQRLIKGETSRQRFARKRVADNTWDAKTRLFEKLIRE